MGNAGMFGKFRGMCVENVDPLQLGRIQVVVPTVIAEGQAVWASACLPPGYVGIPGVGASVWVEFEGGDPALPIWVGLQWTEPGVPPSVESLVLSSGGGRVSLGHEGVTIGSGGGASVVLVGPTVDLNAGALTVT